jgi:ATP-dependent Lon protease
LCTRDPLIEAPVDLSHIVWLATASSLDDLPAALLDRWRVVQFPDPGCQHLPLLAARMMVTLTAERGLDSRWVTPLEDWEGRILADYWPGGSLRSLRRLVQGILLVRERRGTRH